MDLCLSEIALSKDKIDCIATIIPFIDIKKEYIYKISNKELKVISYSKANIIPEDLQEFLRYFIYSLTQETLVIKNKELYNQLRNVDKEKALNLLESYDKEYGLHRLAEIYNRYKNLFLSLKANKKIIKENNKNVAKFLTKFPGMEELFTYTVKATFTDTDKDLNAIINKISHLSKKYYKPMPINELDSFVVWCIENENNKDFEEILVKKIKNSRNLACN